MERLSQKTSAELHEIKMDHKQKEYELGLISVGILFLQTDKSQQF
jgi:hypothetical protein